MDDDSLKQQFKILQEQQKRKLEKRKQRQDEKKKEDDGKNKQPAFGVEDDLGLSIAEPPNEENNIYSAELTEHLNEQIRELKDENGRLFKLLSEKDFEIRILKKKREEDKIAIAGTGSMGADTAATKIVELAKKNRELTAEIEGERTKLRQLQKKNTDLHRDINVLKESNKGLSPAKSLRSEIPEAPSEAEMRTMQEKLKTAETRMSEFRQQTQTLKLELQKAMKVLALEVGDGVSVQSLLAGNSNWKGRQHQISVLQKKVASLKDQLVAQRSDSQAFDLEDEFMGSTMSMTSGASSISRKTTLTNEKNREQIRKMDRERKEAQERAAAELKALETDYSNMKNKLDAAKARNKTLSNENKMHKQQIQTLLEKGQHDDQLIQALMKQQAQLKQLLDQTAETKSKLQEEKEEQVTELSQKAMRESNVVEQLKAIVAEREDKVFHLEQEIQEMRLNNIQKAQMNGVTSLFETSSLSRPQTSSTNHNLQDLQIESMSPSISSRQSTARPSSKAGGDRPGSQFSLRPFSASHRGINNQDLEELRQKSQEAILLQKAAEVERDKLAELVAISQKRYDEAIAKVSESQAELQNQRRINAQLEKHIEKIKLDRNQIKAMSGGRKKTKSSATSLREPTFGEPDSISSDPFASNITIDELQTKLAIQQDENEALKAALQSTLESKEEDLRLYHATVNETREVFLQGLRQVRKS